MSTKTTTPVRITITKRSRRELTTRLAEPKWVKGRVGEYEFAAQIFPEPAVDESYEVRTSTGRANRMSKLTIRSAGTVVFSWDRGPDVAVSAPVVQDVIDALVNTLADYVYDA